MAAICACLNRGHQPYVDVGNPSVEDTDSTGDTQNTVFMQVIGVPPMVSDASEVTCINAKDELKLVKVSWLLAYSCELCK